MPTIDFKALCTWRYSLYNGKIIFMKFVVIKVVLIFVSSRCYKVILEILFLKNIIVIMQVHNKYNNKTIRINCFD